MRRGWRRAAISVAAVTAVLSSAAAVGAALFDPNSLKPDIIQAVQDQTGRALTLNGPLRLRWSLQPALEAGDVTLANLPGGSRPDMARAERIRAQFSIPALLRRRLEVAELTLIGPNILFEQVGGRPNWIFVTPGAANTTPAPGSGAGFGLRIRYAHVVNGMLTSRLPARTRVIGIRFLDLRQPFDGGPLSLASTLVYSDNQPFSLRVAARPVPETPGSWDSQLDFQAFGTTATAHGVVAREGGYDLQIEARSDALEKLNMLLPEMRLPALRQAVLSAHATNSPLLGGWPLLGPGRLQFDGADLGDRLPGVKLGATDVQVAAAGSPATVAAKGRYGSSSFTLSGICGLPAEPNGRESLPMDVTVKLATGAEPGDASVSLKGKLALDKARFAGLDARAAVRAPALAAFGPVLGRTPPALVDVRFDGRLLVPSDLKSVSVQQAALTAREGDVDGQATFSFDQPGLRAARLRSRRLDIDATLAAFGLAPRPPSAPADRSGPLISADPIPWSALREVAVEANLAIESATLRGHALQNLSASVRLGGGKLQVKAGGAGPTAGPLDLSLAADASDAVVPVSLVVHASAVPLSSLAELAGLPGKVSGTARIEADLKAAGSSVHDLASSLAGPFSATSIGGRMSNEAFAKLTSGALDALGIRAPERGETELRCFGLTGAFDRGVGRFQTIALETTYLQLDGAGQIDLGQERVALKLQPMAQISGASVAVPVIVEGPLDAVSARLDADGLDKLGLLIDSWFGGDQSTSCADAGLVPSK